MHFKIRLGKYALILLMVLIVCFGHRAFALVPVVSYSGPQVYTLNVAIPTLTPSTANGTAINGQTGTCLSGGLATSQPLGGTTDSKGNVYIADAGTHSIYKITPSGVVTTFAGGGYQGYANGTGTAAFFYHPVGLACDAADNIYVADEDNHAIRKITPTGVVTTLAGTGSQGSADGTGTNASFYYPCGVTVDASGVLYVADSFNNKIRKITVAGVVSTFAGSGAAGSSSGYGTAASFNQPFSIVVDASSSNLYVTDRANHKIRVISVASALVQNLAGSGTAGFADGASSNASFNAPTGLAIDKPTGNLYVTDEANQRIRKVTSGGTVSTLSGNGSVGTANGLGTTATYNLPFGIALDSKSGFIYVGDDNNHLIRSVAFGAYTIRPNLPAGLSFDITTGQITGTPTETSPATNYTINAYNSSGKSLDASLSITVNAPGTLNLSQDQNYIATLTPRISGITNNTTLTSLVADPTKVQTTVSYLDGIGRPLQAVKVKGSPQTKDIVQPVAYDPYGREIQKYLAYASPSADGSYKTAALTTEIGNFYNPGGSGTSGTQQSNGIVVNPYPYSVTNFEASPLERQTEQGAPGTPWQPVVGNNTGHTVKIEYTTNNETDIGTTASTMIAVLYKVTINSDQSRTLTIGNTEGNYYKAGRLYVTKKYDENWQSGRGGTTEEYKDKAGRILLKRTFNMESGILKILSTYYVYDDLGNLVFVLPPTSGADAGITSAANQTVLDNLCYQYRYDERNRLSRKKLPGKGWEYMVYNKLNQPVLSQDAVQRVSNQWTVTKYDALGRVIITGLWTDVSAFPQSTLQTNIYANAQWDARDNTNVTTGYNVSSYPALNSVLTVDYYDDYLFNGNPYTAFTNSLTTGTKGLLTGSKTAVLNADGTIGQMLWAVHGYDSFGRENLSIKQHYKGGSTGYNTGNMDITSTTYTFNNQIDHSTFAHILAGVSNPKVGVGTQYYYDHMGRQTQIWKVIWDESLPQPNSTLISQTDYNELGQAKIKHLHSPDNGQTFKQAVNYAYNERGWLSSINTPNAVDATQVFGEQLQYNDGTIPQFNGNISGMIWQTMVPAGLGLTQQKQSYAYTYDDIHRLTLANYTTAGATGKFNEQVDYDLVGNIGHLKRTNTTIAGQYLNNFTYDYTTGGVGNKLWGVTDGGTAAQGGTYTYDANGNATTDTRNQITNIKYNLLNLPATVTRTPGNMSYIYDATGEKLQKISGGITREYIDGIEYNNGAIEFVKTEEGRATPSGNTYVYEYYLKDHLGNTRATIRQDGTISQVQDYYAFGMDLNAGNSYMSGTLNNYKFNGKEKQQETSQYDFGARFYDPIIARWTGVDSRTEIMHDYSPFVYSFNNPARFYDKEGEEPKDGASNPPDLAKIMSGPKINMSNAPLSSPRNAAGFQRNGPWFWRQMLKEHPEMFTKDNVARIRGGTSPVINDQWIEYNPAQAGYSGKLIHHHVDGSNMAVGIPEELHLEASAELHANIPRTRLGGLRSSLEGANLFLNVIGLVVDVISDDPHSLGMQFSAGSKLNTLYFDITTKQYFEVTSRNTDKDGRVTTTYDTYSSYGYDERQGKYIGIDKTGTFKAVKVNSIEEAYQYIKS